MTFKIDWQTKILESASQWNQKKTNMNKNNVKLKLEEHVQ